ncbi:hypothetical protein HDE_12960 [Halotydeus destructor]|nr:hypothetical protein HDE_12960 [Halotydeus destructor]
MTMKHLCGMICDSKLVTSGVVDMRCPCPATVEQFQLFIEKYCYGHFRSVSSIILPKWSPRLFSLESEFLGEVLLLAYPSLEKLPHTLAYPRLLLEQYTASTSCRITQLPTPDMLDVSVEQYGTNHFPYEKTFEKMYSSLAEQLHSIDLTKGELLPVRFTEAIIGDLISGNLPSIKIFKFAMMQVLDVELLAQMKTLGKSGKDFIVCVNQPTTTGATPRTCR